MKQSPFSLSSTHLSVSSLLEDEAASSESWSRLLREARKARSLIFAFWWYFFECLLIESSLGLVLVGGVCPLALALTRVVVKQVKFLLALLWANGNEVVKVAIVVASILRPATTPVLAVVVEPCEPTGHKR
jgi:hypothetical protein